MTTVSPPIEIEGLATDYAAGEWIAAHAHDAHQIVHAGVGVLRVVSDTAAWVVPQGRAVWMPAGRVHAIRCHTAVQMRTVYLRGTAASLPEACAVWSVSPLMREIVIRIATSPEPSGREHLLALLLSEIETIDALPLALPRPADARLRRLTEAISADPADRRPLEGWARELAMSERTLIRRFAAETGMTFRQWRRQARLLAALERLAAGEPVTSVAYAIGYNSVSAFIETFREIFGETPGRYFGAPDGRAARASEGR